MIPTLPPRLPRDTAHSTLFSRTPTAGKSLLPRRRGASRAPTTIDHPGRRRQAERRKRGTPTGHPWWFHLAWIVPLLVFDFFLFRWLAARPEAPVAAAPSPVPAVAATPAEAPAPPPPPPPPPPPVWEAMHTPTPQQDLLHPDAPGVLQPTGSGRLVSAKFGSTRIKVGGKPGFHEGVDIAPTTRDKRGRPADPIFAVADGRVAFVNGTAGNSSYGKYIVLEHPDPSLGVRTNASGTVTTSVVYTLYAHLADIRFGVRKDAHVAAGEEIGTMGTTSNTRPPIPNERGHLHWEMGLMLNSRYDRKCREDKLVNSFGSYNGLNLFGIDALNFWAAHARNLDLTFADYLDALPPAADLVLRGRRPDFFERYPSLWKGPAPDGGPILLTISESGMPMRGQNATPEQIARLGNARQAVWQAYPEVLGRNARAYVAQRNGKWVVTDAGRAWADHFFY